MNNEQCVKNEDIKRLDELLDVWKERGKFAGGEVKDVSILFDKLLSLTKYSDKVGFDYLTSVLTTILYSMDMGPGAINYIDDILEKHFWGLFGEYDDGMLNLYNEDGTQVSLDSLMKDVPVQLELDIK